jgi:cellulose synthase/poly-beta-1,6-N-acetylglucosamine synthase-like glycosyltransferase
MPLDSILSPGAAAWANGVFFVYFVGVSLAYLATLVFAAPAIVRLSRRLRAWSTDEQVAVQAAPPITLIIPLYNEEAMAVSVLEAFLSLDYPRYEILAVNDGSTDETLARLTAAFGLEPAARPPTADLPTAVVRGAYRSRLHPNLWVVDKENGGGKADASNTGINYCQTPLLCVLDGDGLLERDALLRAARPFVEDERTVAVGGSVRILNGCRVRDGSVRDVRLPRSWVARVQVLEYLRAFLFGRMGWDTVGALYIISGAFGLFRRRDVVAVGGYSADAIGEDIDLVVRLHRHHLERGEPYRVTFAPDAVAWTEAPESLTVLGRQRDRWQRGLMRTLWRHRRIALNPRYGRLGLLAYPYLVLVEMLSGPIELFGYVVFALSLVLGVLDWETAGVFFAAAYALGLLLSLSALLLEEIAFREYHRLGDVVRLLALSFLEPLVYRPLSAYWRTKGVISYLRGVEGWGAMPRTGFSTDSDSDAVPAPVPA